MTRAFDYMQVPLALIASELTGMDIATEGAYFRAARLIAVNGPMSMDAIRRKIGEQPDIEHALNHISTDEVPLYSFNWLEEWRGRAEASRERLSIAGHASAKARAKKKGNKKKKSTQVEQVLDSSSTSVEHTTILSSSISSLQKERASEVEVIPEGFTVSHWRSIQKWFTYREQSKKKMAPMSKDSFIAKWKAKGEAATVSAIEHSIEKGYQGCFEPDTTHKANGHQQSTEDQRRAERIAHIAAMFPNG